MKTVTVDEVMEKYSDKVQRGVLYSIPDTIIFFRTAIQELCVGIIPKSEPYLSLKTFNDCREQVLVELKKRGMVK